uniref:Uncharacterized protein n=1 Tax=Avena sativa TaxID=4498 RepID=A0ACD5Z7Y7_AVESA
MPCLIVADSHFSPPSRILDPRKKGSLVPHGGGVPRRGLPGVARPRHLHRPRLRPSRRPRRADLVRAAAVSRTWRRFVIGNNLSKSLCVRLCPEVATIAATAEVTIPLPSAPAPESDSERDYRIYSNLARALVSNSGDRSVGCVLRCVGASSTDYFPNETMVHTLDEHELVNLRPSYWSSCGADDPEEQESLTYRLNSDVCIVDEIRVQPFLAFFQGGQPIYSSKMVRFRMGHYKLPRGSESFVTDEDENKMVNADNKYMWT